MSLACEKPLFGMLSCCTGGEPQLKYQNTLNIKRRTRLQGTFSGYCGIYFAIKLGLCFSFDMDSGVVE
jgi:hypothetical protein